MTLRARSVTSSMSPVHAPVDRYFHPPSQMMTTMTPSSISAAHFTAAATMAPDEGVIVVIICDGGWKYLSTGAWTGDLDEVTERARRVIYF
jgi:hypothetical protein